MQFYWVFLFIVIIMMWSAAQQAQADEEERNPDLDSPGDGWEYKILRSPRKRFKDLEFQRQVLAEDAEAGWSLLEKFDNTRLRLKRPVSAREHDELLDFDPYRISVTSMLEAIKQRTQT
ncbi:MAG: hypothetical protein VB855_19010 [Pirellulaceae bacterium]